MIPDRFKYKLFGRFKGRKKNQPLNPESITEYVVDIDKEIDITKYNILDIGSGSGENSIHLSLSNYNNKIIACELFEDGNINLVKKIKENNIKNIRLYNGNVLEFLDLLGTKELFNEIWILFPDPWPKNRHHKRRLINNRFIKILSSYLKNNGKLFIVSDSDSYKKAIFMNIYDSKSIFFWKNQRVSEWNYECLGFPETKFYKKAKKSNRNSILFELVKI
jgi:tRNA (guanine-N7-)-methyltransferase